MSYPTNSLPIREGSKEDTSVNLAISPQENKSWKVDLQQVSSRLNVSVSHLVDKMVVSSSLGNSLTPESNRTMEDPHSAPMSVPPAAERTFSPGMAPQEYPKAGTASSLVLPSPTFTRSLAVPGSAAPTKTLSASPKSPLSFDLAGSCLSIHKTTRSPTPPLSDECSYGTEHNVSINDPMQHPAFAAISEDEQSLETTALLHKSVGSTHSITHHVADEPEEKEKKGKKRVKFFSHDGNPIESVYVYEATNQDNTLFLDVRYSRPQWAWFALLIINGALAYAAYDVQNVKTDSSLGTTAGPVLAWWTSFAQALLFAIPFPYFFWSEAYQESKSFLCSKKGMVLLISLGFVMATERALAQVALFLVHGKGEQVMVQISITLYTAILVAGAVLMGKVANLAEIGSTIIALIGMGVMGVSAVYGHGVQDTKALIGGVFIGLASSCFAALELALAHKLRNSLNLVLLLFVSQLISSLFHFPIALAWGASIPDIFSEIETYSKTEYITAVIALTIGNALLIHILAFLHPITVSIAITAQLLLIISLVIADTSLLGAGFLIGMTLVLASSGWGSFLSAQARRDVSFEFPLTEED